MCNNCECDFSYLCSSVGHLKYGACCEKCDNYDEMHTCPYYAAEVIKPQKELIPTFEILPKTFSPKLGKTPEETIELYP